MKYFAMPVLFAALLSAAGSGIPAAMNAFTAAAYKQVAVREGNLILSPFNIATALSMAFAGARGQTAQEMESVLHLQGVSQYDAELGSLLAQLSAAGNAGKNELHTANALWVQRGFAIEPAFTNTLRDNYRAPLTPLDFKLNPEAARTRINRWTEEQTKDKIKDLLPAGSLDARTRLVLTSAIYFYGKWQNPFAASSTQPAAFTLANGAAMRTNFMNQTAHFGYAETADAQILEMRYADTGMAFDVLLPKSATGLPDLEKSLGGDSLTSWTSSLMSRKVQVSIPKFRAESEFSLRKELAAMGMPAAFSDKADFSGIDPNRGIQVSDVFHKAFVDVSEEGTEAAAATGIAMRAATAMAPQPMVVFRADHPFVFLIRDTRTGVVLFVGRLTNPKPAGA